MKKSRKLTYISAVGAPVKYVLSEAVIVEALTSDGQPTYKIHSMKKISEGNFTEVLDGYSYSYLENPQLLSEGKEYLVSVEYGTSDTVKYIRTKFVEGFDGYDGYEDDVFKTGDYSTISTTGYFPVVGGVLGRGFYYDFKFGFETYDIKKEVYYIEVDTSKEGDALNGLTVGLLGSSTMDTSRTGVNFMEHIASRTGLVLENYAVGGQSTTATRQDWENDDGRRGLNKTKQMITEKPDVDLVLVQPLINDEYLPLGTFEVEDPTTCYGAMHIIAKMLLEAYQEKPIGFITGQYFPAAPGLNTARESLRHKCIKEIGYYYGIPVLDLRAEGQTPYMLQWFKDKYVPDGTHLNDAGNRIIARPVEAFVRRITQGM